VCDHAVDGGDVGLAIDDDQLAAEVLDRPEALATVGEELADGHVTVESPLHQRVQGGDLEGAVGLGGEVGEPALPEALQVEGTDQAVIDDVSGHGGW